MALDIRTALKERGKTQAWLADEVGVSRGYMSELLSQKKSPSHELLLKLASALNVSPAKLFDEESPIPEPGETGTMRQGFAEAGSACLAPPGAGRTSLAAIASTVRHSQNYIATETLPVFLMQRGDVITVDAAAKAKPGDIVVINQVNMITNESVSHVARWTGHNFLLGDPTASIQTDHDVLTVSIMGVVRGLSRSI
ncbi:helix-turn-helix transcriptional regulator [uncultured Sulfitobacter sp.]|uniref:helix-turn-helix transcriptional regulator n=1 Tax=uncultured Sulfitobacter sp. TaxID=191468 RepID=UPI002633DDB9|nr:helix-turn-helix transcriptional regulator [uncultured Sulfitobacter sp.]